MRAASAPCALRAQRAPSSLGVPPRRTPLLALAPPGAVFRPAAPRGPRPLTVAMAGPAGNLFNLGAVPIAVMTDSYKAGHFMMYPDALKMVAVRGGGAGKGGARGKRAQQGELFYPPSVFKNGG